MDYINIKVIIHEFFINFTSNIKSLMLSLTLLSYLYLLYLHYEIHHLQIKYFLSSHLLKLLHSNY